MGGRGRRERARGVTAPDRGATFVELLVAIVLLGTVVVGTLAGLRAAVIASTIDEDQSRAYAWLQSAADALERVPYIVCTPTNNAAIVAAYQATVDGAARPSEWTAPSGATLVVVSVTYLSRTGGVESWGTDCAAGDPDSPVYPQLVTLRATTPDGAAISTLEVVKSV